MTDVQTTWDWFSTVPLAYSTGSTLAGWYEGAKKSCGLTNYALQAVEGTVKVASSVAQPVVKKLEGPIASVDAYALQTCKGFEEKYPSLKKPTEEVIADTKEAVGSALKSGSERVGSLPGAGLAGASYSTGKAVVVGTANRVKTTYTGTVSAVSQGYTSGKDRIASGYTTGKETIASGYNSGRERLVSGYTAGKDYIVEGIKSGSAYAADTRAGHLVGGGVGRLISVTDSIVDYVLPEVEDTVREEMEEGEEEICEKAEELGSLVLEEAEGQVARARTLSRKVRVRMYRRTMTRLRSLQQGYQDLLSTLKAHTELLKLANSVKSFPAQGYHSAEEYLQKIRNGEVKMVPEGLEEKLQWIRNKSGDLMFSSVLQSARNTAGDIIVSARALLKGASYLPQSLSEGASRAVCSATAVLESLQKAEFPSDLPKSTLATIGGFIDRQMEYATRLRHYISASLASYLYLGKGKESDLTELTLVLPPEDSPASSLDNTNTDTPLSERPLTNEDLEDLLSSEGSDEEEEEEENEEDEGAPSTPPNLD